MHALPHKQEAGTKDRAPALTLLVFSVGYVTISAQIVLLREIFTALHGSDICIAVTLASWTTFSALGAWGLGGRLGRTRLQPHWGLVLYTILVIAVFLRSRQQATADVVLLQDFLRIPALLALPCLLGGSLFSWAVGWASRHCATARPAATAYADETLGGLCAGLLLTAYFSVGGTPSAVLLLSLLGATVQAVLPSPRKRIPRWSLPALPLTLLALALQRPMPQLERQTLQLKFPDYRILEHRHSPRGDITALHQDGSVHLFANGLPLPSRAGTPSKTAIAALPAVFAPEWGDMLAINAVRSGFGSSLRHYRHCRLVCFERDPALLAFMQRWAPGARPPPTVDLRCDHSPWRTVRGELFHTIVQFAAPPMSLQDNQQLTIEHFRRARAHLTPAGMLAVLLPAAPGFSHPLQEGWLNSIQLALDSAFPFVERLDTDLGFVVLLGGSTPLVSVDAARFAQRFAVLNRGLIEQTRDLVAAGSNPVLPRLPPDGHVVANTVAFPFAYFAYARFGSALVNRVHPFWRTLLEPRSFLFGAACVCLLFAATAVGDHACPGTAALFWSSWVATMTLMFSLYIYQSIIGQAYWLVALITAVSLGGIYLGARSRASCLRRPDPSMVALGFLPLIFLVEAFLQDLPHGLLLCVLGAGNALVGLNLGRRFAAAAAANSRHRNIGGVLFCIDLLGGAGGLLIGAILLPFWVGLRTTGVLCGLAALLNAPRRS